MKRRFYTPTFAKLRPLMLPLLLLTLLFALGGTAMAVPGPAIVFDGTTPVDGYEPTVGNYMITADFLTDGKQVNINSGAVVTLQPSLCFELQGNKLTNNGSFVAGAGTINLTGTAAWVNEGSANFYVNDLLIQSGHVIHNSTSTLFCYGTLELGDGYMLVGYAGNSPMTWAATTVDPADFRNITLYKKDGSETDARFYQLIAKPTFDMSSLDTTELGFQGTVTWHTDAARASDPVGSLDGFGNISLYAQEAATDLVPTIYKDGVTLTDQAADTITMTDSPTYTYNEADFAGYTAVWSVDSSTVAGIGSETGAVTPNSAGSTPITLTLSQAGTADITKTFTLTVGKAEPSVTGSALLFYKQGSAAGPRVLVKPSNAFVAGGYAQALKVYTKVSGVETQLTTVSMSTMTMGDMSTLVLPFGILETLPPAATYTIYASAEANDRNEAILETEIGQLYVVASDITNNELHFRDKDGNVVEGNDLTLPASYTPYTYALCDASGSSMAGYGSPFQCASSDKSVATVEVGGDPSTPQIKITAVQPGYATITVLYTFSGTPYMGTIFLEVNRSKPVLKMTSPSGEIRLSGKQGQFQMASDLTIDFTLTDATVSAQNPYKVFVMSPVSGSMTAFVSCSATSNGPGTLALSKQEWTDKLNTLPVGSHDLYLYGMPNDNNQASGGVIGQITVTANEPDGPSGGGTPDPTRPEPINVDPANPMVVSGNGTVTGDIEFKNVVGSGLLARVFLRNGSGELVVELTGLPVLPVDEQPRTVGQLASVRYVLPADKISKLPLGTYTLWVDSEGNAENLPVPATQIGVLVIDMKPDPVIGKVTMPTTFKITKGFSAQLVQLTDGDTMPAFSKIASKNKKIATLDENGVLTGVRTGNVQVYYKLNGKTKKCTVTVVKNQYGWKKAIMGKKGAITLSTGRLEYMLGGLHLDVWVSNKTQKTLKNIADLKYELYDKEGNLLLSVPFELMRKVPSGKNVFQCLQVTEEMLPGVADKVYDLACGGLRARIVGWEDAVYTGKAIFEGDDEPNADGATDVPPLPQPDDGSAPEATPTPDEPLWPTVPSEPTLAHDPTVATEPDTLPEPVAPSAPVNASEEPNHIPQETAPVIPIAPVEPESPGAAK